jgi:hypothetical protein
MDRCQVASDIKLELFLPGANPTHNAFRNPRGAVADENR